MLEIVGSEQTHFRVEKVAKLSNLRNSNSATMEWMGEPHTPETYRKYLHRGTIPVAVPRAPFIKVQTFARTITSITGE
jgi:hypothetical protein